ncbi:hypothetical protein EYB26_004198 [Talaromyces marneffei]|uniref:uncharacterized protein n=1 Tax=Talaromyces marneffei TaxID=37727 RepID=UPI0012A9550E|nr:uncharacterized protein EYB26_004198 [Talaromyces marneffei]QGA16531.1 hypothetical protein EYB26_004198 [Talaromyces marneffei]
MPTNLDSAGRDESAPRQASRDYVSSAKLDPAVIVGMACRVPGATSPSQLWRVLAEQRDLQRKMPAERYNVDAFYHPVGTNKGTTSARYGYFLDQDLGLFDNEFFHISGKEAQAMDPQQRLLLEVVYEALEDVGITLDEISGTKTSVFVGSFSSDYRSLATDLLDYPQYTAIGIGGTILANRISYFYNLSGPSMTIDTACSSSLVCFHLGNQSIQRGESEISIIAGSAIHFDPFHFITMTDLGLLSSDGRCRTYDAAGSGYVRGEGVCAVILKRRSQAELSNDPIRAVIRATGANHDGFKDGLTVPNGEAQARLIRETYKEAGILPLDTHYFEAHGTGTRVGDPIEAKAIGSIFAPGRDRPLVVGSLKSNLGHLEGASGLAGVIKATLTIESGKIMPNMHFNVPNPSIDFENLKLKVPTEIMDWNDPRRRASINSFGYGGTNAHVVLENYKPTQQLSNGDSDDIVSILQDSQRPYLLPLSSHNEKAADHLCTGLAQYVLENPQITIPDLVHTFDTKRSLHNYRSFALLYNLDSAAQLIKDTQVAAKWTRSPGDVPRVGFIFTGQGAQSFDMGRQLIQQMPLFHQVLERCDRLLHSLPDRPEWSCVDELLKSEEESRLSQSRYSQPLCTALQLALLEVLSAWGISPHAVVGHSSGEIAAAYAAGVLSFENAITCAYYRGLYMSKGLKAVGAVTGAMLAVGLTEREGRAEIAPYQGRIDLAAINSPSNITLSGDEDAILELKGKLDERQIFSRKLQVEQAFHSHHMLPLSSGFEQALSLLPAFKSHPPRHKFISSVTGRHASTETMCGSYWARNMTGVVRFAEAVTETLLDDNDEQDVDIFVEIGPHPALKGPVGQILKAMKIDVPYIPSLSRNVPAFESLLSMAGQLFQAGYPVDLRAVNSTLSYVSDGEVCKMSTSKRLKDVPTYAWDHHARFWYETRPEREFRLRPYRHSILGSPVPTAPNSRPQWRNYLRLNEIPWLLHHVVDSKVVFPGAGYISMALEAIATRTPNYKRILIREIVFKSALTLAKGESGTEVILELQPQVVSAKQSSRSWYRFTVFSFDDSHSTNEHCHGLICAEEGTPVIVDSLGISSGVDEVRKATNQRRPQGAYYKRLQKLGLDYGETFQLIDGDVESGLGFSVANLTFQPEKLISTQEDRCILHPTLLDSSFHTMFASIESLLGRPLDGPFVPTFIRSMVVSGHFASLKHDMKPQHYWVKSDAALHGLRLAVSKLSIQAHATNDVLVSLDGFEATALGNSAESEGARRRLYFRNQWKPAFDHLVDAELDLNTYDLSTLMDFYVHQHPAAKILHVTPTLARVYDVLRHLGGADGTARRFEMLTPYHYADETNLKAEIEARWPTLIDFKDPKQDAYDIIVISKVPDCGIKPFLKNGAFVISEVREFNIEGFIKLVETDNFAIWRNSQVPASTTGTRMTVLISSNPSERTKSIVAAIASDYDGEVITRTLTETSDNRTDDDDDGVVVALVSLDEDLFFNPELPEKEQYRAIQGLLSGKARSIVWVTCGATHESQNPAQAIIIGLARVAQSENTDSKLTTLDISQAADANRVSKSAIRLLLDDGYEGEAFLGDGLLCIPRLVVDDELNAKLPTPGNRKIRLEPLYQNRNLTLNIGKTGLLDTLHFEEDGRFASKELADDAIEIEVKASAMNFRDVAVALGMIDEHRLGSECAGIIRKIGRGVSTDDFKPGDRVMAMVSNQGSHGVIVRTPSVFCIKIGDMDFATAASLGTVGATALYSLVDMARLQPGEYCLIHSAAGGVGQMAIGIAQMIGAKVLATVGSPSKRAFLKERFGLEDDAIFSSRDSSFIEGVLKATGGRGCDVALNSLAGPLLLATWNIVAPFGRLVEIGKRDVHENSKLDMDPFRKNLTYAAVDLNTMDNLNKPLLGRLVRESFDLVTTGKIKPPYPITKVSFADAQKAFRLVQMGTNMGKVVLIPGGDDVVPVLPPTYTNQLLFSTEKTYLIVGGLGGIGRRLAQWMFQRGARRLAFLARSGTEREEAKAIVAWLRARNVDVSVFKGDVTDFAVVQHCIDTLGKSLSGIIQAAMVLSDAPLATMSHQQWRAAVRPKVIGTYNLHLATQRQKLDFFLTFSSSAAIIGSKGQANYCAANCYLDALMRNRRAQGLAGTTVNIGPVSGIGAVAEDAILEKVMDRMGYESITEDELFWAIEEAITSAFDATQEVDGIQQHQIITGLNLQRTDLYWANKSLVRNLYANLDGVDGGKAAAQSQDIALAIQREGTVEERVAMLTAAFIEKIADVLFVPVSTIHSSNPLSSYGLDSIIAVEFRTWFLKTVTVDVSLFDILAAKSIEALVEQVVGMMPMIRAAEPHDGTANAGGEVDISSDSPARSSPEDGSALLPNDEGKALNGPKDAVRSHRVPLSPYQLRLWSAHRLLDDKSALNFVVLYSLNGRPNPEILQKTALELAKRNASLRTMYFEGPDFPEQALSEDVALKFSYHDLSLETQPEVVLQTHAQVLRHQALGIERGENTALGLFKLAEDRYSLIFVFHHISIDNGSTKSAMGQFVSIYDALSRGVDLSTIPSPSVTYSDFSFWYNQRLHLPDIQSSIAWWMGELCNAPQHGKLLPFARESRPAKILGGRNILRQSISSAKLKRMKRICLNQGATPFHFLVACLRAFIYRFTQERDWILLTMNGSRPHPDLEDVVGFFVNIVPFRFRNACEGSFENVLAEAKGIALDALGHSQIPFDVMLDACNIERSPSYHPLGQVFVNYKSNKAIIGFSTDHFVVEDLVVEDMPTPGELALEAVEDGKHGLQLRLEYDSFLYGQQDMEVFFKNLTYFLLSVIQDYRVLVGDVEID